jgi:hypothetical protein
MTERFKAYTLNKPKLRKTVGWFLVIVGIIAVVAPLIPGAPLLFIGLEILGLRLIFAGKISRFFTKETISDTRKTLEKRA